MSLYNIYERGSGTFNTAKLCHDEDPNNILAIVESHVARLTRKGPLGDIPGFYLHDGPSLEDPIIAAVGEVSRSAAKALSFNCNSTVMLPSLAPTGAMVTETMRAATSPDKVPVFRFSIEVGTKELQRENFEWRKVKKFADTGTGGFQLFRAKCLPGGASETGGSALGHAESLDVPETVAVLTWAKGALVRKHEFTLSLKGSGLSGELGDRWTLAVVMTALRLWYMRWLGRTSKFSISIGEMIRGEAEGP